MKKTLIIISSILLINCTNTNDFSQDEKLSINPKEYLSKSSAKLLANNLAEITVMDLDLGKALLQPSGGGCSFETGYSIENIHTSTAAFGPNPITFFGYIFRGYGKPRTDGFLWKGIKFENDNRPKTIINRGQPMITNNPMSNAISIEFPFQANVTYQITLEASITDYIWLTKNNTYHLDNDHFDVDQSEEAPTFGIELSNTPEINGDDPCGNRPFTKPSDFVNRNYYKHQKIQFTQHVNDKKELIFNFSTNEAKNAMIIYFLPGMSENRISTNIPKNAFTMYLTKIKIIQKPFDPAYYEKPCGFRGDC